MSDATPGPVLALRGAILARCAADAALAALMGGAARLHDEPPRAAEPLYALFGDASARDDSTDGGPAHRHEATIVVWARPGSARSALLVAERLACLLREPALEPAGHHLVWLRVAAIESARDERTGLATVTLRLAALTEPAPHGDIP